MKSAKVATLGLIVAISIVASAERADDRPVASVEGLTEYVLDNGLRVVLFPDPSQATATVNITYFVGSRHEAYGETGMAHLLEHLVFKGTPNHKDIPRELTEHGARPNGTTSLDRTNYFETFPATDDNLDWALDLEADRMVNSFIAKKDLDSEMTVVRNEMERGENSPMRILMSRVISTAYLWHNYGNSTIGARSDVEGVPIERLQGFYRRYYQPDNAMLVVAGKIDPAKTLKLVREKFGRIPRPDRAGADRLWPTYTDEPTQDGERSVTLRRTGDVQLVMHSYHVPAGSHEDAAAIDVLTQVLGDEPSGRLYKALVEPKKAAQSGAFGMLQREAGVLLAFAEVRQEASLDSADAALAAAVDGLADAPVTTEEVDRARTSMLKNIDNTINNSERLALELSEWGAMGDWRLFFVHRDRIKKVTHSDVQRVALAYLKPSNRTVGKFIPTAAPDRAEVPAAPDITGLVKDYKGSGEVATGEAFDTDPKAIEARIKRVALGNGMKVALLPKKTRGQTVMVTINLQLGSLDTLKGRVIDGSMAGSMLMRGTTKHTRQEIQDTFDRLKAQVFVGGGQTGAFASIQTTRENLPAVLKLVAEVFREPAFNESEFSLLKEQALSGIESQLSEPGVLAGVALGRHMSPYPADHPLYNPTLPEQKERLLAATVSGAREFHQKFYGAGSGVAAIVGDFYPEAIAPLMGELFGDWEAATPFVRIPEPFFDVPAEQIVIQTPDKANAVYLTALNIKMSDEHADYPAIRLADYMLGGGFLSSRLATRIRQKDGLSYGVRSSFNAPALDEAASFSANAIYAPENVAKLEKAFAEEFARAAKDGFAADEVEKAKLGFLESRKNGRGQDRFLAGSIVQKMVYDRTMLHDAQLDAKIASLTAEQVNAAYRRHIDPSKLTVVKAGDFKEPAK